MCDKSNLASPNWQLCSSASFLRPSPSPTSQTASSPTHRLVSETAEDSRRQLARLPLGSTALALLEATRLNF